MFFRVSIVEVLFLIFILFSLGAIENFFLTSLTGKPKRGIKIWGKPLQLDMLNYLRNLSSDVIEFRRVGMGKTVYSFIKVESKEVIIYSRDSFVLTPWPYVGYVDLSEMKPHLQYRTGLLWHLSIFLMPFFIGSVFLSLPFFISGLLSIFGGCLIVIANFWIMTQGINRYLEDKYIFS